MTSGLLLPKKKLHAMNAYNVFLTLHQFIIPLPSVVCALVLIIS